MWLLRSARKSSIVRNKCSIRITSRFLVAFAVLILLLPLKWLAAWFLAVAVHEASHCGAILLCRQPIESLSIDIWGAKIQTRPFTNIQTAICAFAGPVGGFLLLIFLRNYPELALCGLIQSVYNLFPIYPLDGGRILYSLASIFFSGNAAGIICKTFSVLFLLLFFLFCLFVAIVLKSSIPCLAFIILFLQQRRN